MDTHAVTVMLWRHRLFAPSSPFTLGAGTIAALGAIYLGNRVGWWWTTFAVGFGVGLVLGGWRALVACGLFALGVWGGELSLRAMHGGVGRIAQVTGGLMGLGNHAGALVVALTLVYGVLLCLGGGWLGLSLARLLRVRPAASPVAVPAIARRPMTTAPAMPSVITVHDTGPALRVSGGNGAPSLRVSTRPGLASAAEISPGSKEELPNVR